MTDQTKAVRSSVVDGIAITPRYRERQLASLHVALLTSRSNLTKVLIEETSLTSEEATAQFLLTAKAIKTYHTSVNPEKCLQEEYQIAQGKNNATRRVPYGYAYIIPSQHDPLYSTLVPVAAAIAAGNCVVLELQNTTSQIGPVLRNLLTDSLSSQTFAIVNSPPFDAGFTTKYCIELNAREMENALTTSRRLCTEAGRVAAIIDRSGDIKNAAKECVKARFGFGGRSAYAPDIILVNEFCVQAFCSSVAENALHYLSGVSNGKIEMDKETSHSRRNRGISSDLQKKLEKSGADVLVAGDRGTVAVLKTRDDNLSSQKLDSPLLLIMPISSMDDAINLLAREKTTLRANYLFSAPTAAKYLGQFISSSITTINHIPNELLVGPPAPMGHSISLQPRYTTDMFSIAQPEIFEVSELSNELSVILSQMSDVKERRKSEESLDVNITRVKEAFGPPVGFFEQGILFGLSCVLVSAATVGTLTFKYAAPVVLARLRGS